MNLRDLLERRTKLVAEMRQITTSPAGNGGDLSAEQATKFDSLKADLETTERSIARQQLVDDAERRAAGQQIAGSGDAKLDEALRNFSLRRAICSQIPDLAPQVDFGRERELSAEIARRAGRPFNGVAVPLAIFQMEKRTLVGAGGSPDSGGINLIATDLRPDQFIDVLRAKMVVRRLGARVLSGLVGNLDIPRQASAAATAWVGEDSALTPGDPTYQKLSFTPNHCGALSEFSRNMLLQSSPDIEQLLRMDFAKALANALDVAALGGAGGSEPTGILNTSGLSTVAGPVTWAAILSLVETIEEANAEPTGWVTTPGMKRLLRSTVRVGSTDSVMVMESAKSMADYPVAVTNNVPATLGSPAESDALVLGDWTDLMIAIWSELDILVNPFDSTAYRRGNVMVRGMMTVDLAPRHIASFAAMTNVSPG